MRRSSIVSSLTGLAAMTLLTACGVGVEPRAPEPLESAADYQVETVASGFDWPWGLAFLPDGRMLVTERSGALRLVDESGLQADPVAGTPPVYFAGQGGLLDIALSPQFETDGLVYLSYSHGDDSASTTALYRARFDGEALADGELVWTASPDRAFSNHYGGRLAFLPDGTLLLTLGDAFALREQAQNRTNHLGSIVRLNPDGSAPTDNPFAGRPSDADGPPLPEIYSYGHRNVQGISFDAATGRIWSHEHGPAGGDELNLIRPGANYGWPIATAGLDYSGARISPFSDHEGFEAPKAEWSPSIAPSGLAVYSGALFEGWAGDLFVTALAGEALHRIVLDEDGAVIGEELLLAERGERLRHVLEGPDGALYVLTDSDDGAILKLTPAPQAVIGD
ncbi:MAG: PQQ-dependent sugar dehydrogenase [Pseudomonadota bacterium]